MDSYSVLVIADGDGWDAGEYTIMASYGADSDTDEIILKDASSTDTFTLSFAFPYTEIISPMR